MPVKERHKVGALPDIATGAESEWVDCSAADAVMFFFETGTAGDVTVIEISPDKVVAYPVLASQTTWAAAGRWAYGLSFTGKFARLKFESGGAAPITNAWFDALRTIA